MGANGVTGTGSNNTQYTIQLLIIPPTEFVRVLRLFATQSLYVYIHFESETSERAVSGDMYFPFRSEPKLFCLR